MKDVYIISDVHGNYEGLEAALELVPRENSFVVQIGDLANCVRASIEDDLACLSMVGEEIDLMLIGNHEIPYFDPVNRFAGFHLDQRVKDCLWDLYGDGLLSASYAKDDSWLVTHAGISQSQLNLGTLCPFMLELGRLFTSMVVDEVLVLTRSPYETYKNYIERVKQSGGIALEVKKADLQVNLERSHGHTLEIRYKAALEVLNKEVTMEFDPEKHREKTFRIVRFKAESDNRVIKRGLTLEEAQAHCSREDTHGEGWFDGYEEEK